MKTYRPVDLPDTRVSFKKGPNGTKYVYYTLRSYRNAAGKSTSDEISIGKLDADSGQLIPNKNYFDVFPAQRADRPQTIQSVGYLKGFFTLAERIGLTPALQPIFGDKTESLLALAAYMMAHGNVMMDYSDWAENTGAIDIQPLSSQRISALFSEIQPADRQRFFQEWVKKADEDEYIAYDVTSISSYSDGISIVERGYNRDKEHLSQVNLGMYYGESSRLPLYYSVYSGSLVDKTYLPFMMALAESLDMKHIRFVMDQGFLTQKNVRAVHDKSFTLLSLLPKNTRLYKDILTEALAKPFSVRERLAKQELYARTVQTTFDSVPVAIYIYFDSQKAVLDEKALFDDIQRKETELSHIAKQNAVTPGLKKYFAVETSGETEVNYTLDYDKIDALKSRLGYFALISTDLSLTADRAIRIYRQKDVIEKSFDQLKNGMDYRRMRTHYTPTTEGKIFVAFLGLIMRSYFMRAIKSDATTSNMTLKKVHRELEKIQHIQLKDGTIEMMPLTKVQKQILKALQLEDIFNA